MALPTNGRVVLETTVGDIEIEMWSKEAPKACRNFIALAMEGYYDGVIFHRVVAGFLVQTGDRTGSGGGGESFFGEPFADEIHPRLRFAHRGIIACANNGEKNTNDSQFFITLEKADGLHGKHTIWGRCVGDTFFNALKIGQMETDENERPLYPPKIKSIKILDNPFDDIVPRVTAAEKKAQQQARESAQKERDEALRRRSAKKNTALLSFGMGEGTVEDEEPVAFKKKSLVRPDLIDDPKASILTGSIPEMPEPPKTKRSRVGEGTGESSKPETSSQKKEGTNDLKEIRAKHAKEQAAESTGRQKEIQKMEDDIRKLTRRRDGAGSDSEEERAMKKSKGTSYLAQELSKYAKNKGAGAKRGKKRDESDLLAALNSFQDKLKMAHADDGQDETPPEKEGAVDGEQEGMEIDDDKGWMHHQFKFDRDDGGEAERAFNELEVIDPRARGHQAKEQERERKQTQKSHISKVYQQGHRGGR